MLTMRPADLAASVLSRLTPGQLFCHQGAVCMALKFEEARRIWIRLSGTNPFEFHMLSSGDLKVLPLSIAPENIVLRFDPNSVPANPLDNTPGRLVVLSQGGAYIQGYWENLKANPEYRNAVELLDWSHVALEVPKYAFDSWALSVLNPDGTWFDVAAAGKTLATAVVTPLKL